MNTLSDIQYFKRFDKINLMFQLKILKNKNLSKRYKKIFLKFH